MKKIYRITSLVITVCVLPFWMTGCASMGTYNPATGKKELIFISVNQELSLGRSMHKRLLKEFKISSNLQSQLRLERVARPIASVSDRQDYKYKFYLLEKDELNAMTTPGGNIYVFTGLMDRLTNDDELAAVLAHEVAHCAAKHVVKKFQASFSYNLIGSIISSQVDGGAGAMATRGLKTAMGLIFTAYSREDEYQADKIAVRYLYLAGFDPKAMARSLERIKKDSKGAKVPVIFRSHPYIEDRVDKAMEEALKYKGSK